jgi:hypothetical protein
MELGSVTLKINNQQRESLMYAGIGCIQYSVMLIRGTVLYGTKQKEVRWGRKPDTRCPFLETNCLNLTVE